MRHVANSLAGIISIAIRSDEIKDELEFEQTCHSSSTVCIVLRVPQFTAKQYLVT